MRVVVEGEEALRGPVLLKGSVGGISGEWLAGKLASAIGVQMLGHFEVKEAGLPSAVEIRSSRKR